MEILPNPPDALLGASCSLSSGEMRDRLADWRKLRNRAIEIERLDEGVLLRLALDEPMDAVARLVALESECCAFYRFTIDVFGDQRTLTIEAGPGNAAAVYALAGLD